MHLTSIWMLTPFTIENGGTYVVPDSHRCPNNPAAGGVPEVHPDSPYPTKTQVTGPAGSVLALDSRIWHAVASIEPRVALVVRYAPWWLNLNPARVGSPEYTQMVVETSGKAYEIPLVKSPVFEQLPESVKPLLRHWVRPEVGNGLRTAPHVERYLFRFQEAGSKNKFISFPTASNGTGSPFTRSLLRRTLG